MFGRNKIKLSEHTEVGRNEWGDDWLQSHWRPLAACVYLAICCFDFIVGPIMFTIFAGYTSTGLLMWEPLTVQGGGLFHLSFLAILGVASWTRGMEKVERTREKGRTRDRFDRDSRSSSDYEFKPPEDFGSGN